MGSEKCRDDGATAGCEHIAVSMRNLADELVSAQERDAPCGTAGVPALFGAVARRSEESGAQVAVAEAVDEPFRAGDSLEQGGVGLGPGIECTEAAAFARDGTSERLDESGNGRFDGDRGQGGEVAVINGGADLGPARCVGDTLAQWSPAFGGLGCALGRPKDPKILGIGQGGLHAQDLAMLVIEFKSIAIDEVLEADAFGAMFAIGLDRALIEAVCAAVGG